MQFAGYVLVMVTLNNYYIIPICIHHTKYLLCDMHSHYAVCDSNHAV